MQTNNGDRGIWVLVVVVALFVLATIGIIWKNSPKTEAPVEPTYQTATESIPPTEVKTWPATDAKG